MAEQGLHLACKKGHYQTVETLLNHGYNVNGRDSHGITPLMYACLHGHTDIVRLLLSKGADVNMQDHNGWSALMAASKDGHTDVIHILIEKGVQVNMQKKDGWSALMAASQNGHSHSVKVLIEKGAQVNMQMKNGLSALMIACENEHNSVVKLLIEKGARMNMLRNDGWSALMIACYCGRGEVTQILLDHHADTNIQDTDGKTAFSCACETGHTEIVELLLSCKHIKTLPQTVHADTFSTPKSSEQEKEKYNVSQPEEVESVTNAVRGKCLGAFDQHTQDIQRTTSPSKQVKIEQDLSLKGLSMELKTVTNPIIRKNNQQAWTTGLTIAEKVIKEIPTTSVGEGSLRGISVGQGQEHTTEQAAPSHATKVDALLSSNGLTYKDGNRECKDDHILNISMQLEQWELVATWLGLTAAEREAIKGNNQTIEMMRYNTLKKWKSKALLSGTATYRVLLQALLDCGCNDQAKQVCSLLKESLLY